jgi:hypothetical protein
MRTDLRGLHRVSVSFGLSVAMSVPSVVSAQVRPDFSGTWRSASRSVGYPLTIQQTSDTLTIEARGLPQGPPTEVFALDGSPRTAVLTEYGYWRRYDTTGRWEGSTFIGTVTATAGWTDKSTPDGNSLRITSHCHSPEKGGGDGERQKASFNRR